MKPLNANRCFANRPILPDRSGHGRPCHDCPAAGGALAGSENAGCTRHGLWPALAGITGAGNPPLNRFHAGRAGRNSLARRSRTVLGEEAHLPFPDAMFDRIVLIHALEESQSPPHMLREIWRILAPQGRLALIVPNRAGLWARMESTPFGHGRPFSKGQLSRLLTDAALTPTAWARALYAPPWRWSCKDGRALGWEQAGEKIAPHLGGLILAEAVKNTGALTPRPARPVRVRLPGLEGRPATALSPRRHHAKEN